MIAILAGRRRLVYVAMAVVLAMVAAAAYDHCRRSEWSADGPVRLPYGQAFIVRKRVGEVFTDGLERVILTGHEPGVLRKVELAGPQANHFKIVGVLVAGPQRRLGSWELSDGFPPHKPRLGPLVPAVGAFLPAGGLMGTVLLIGLKVVKPGLGVRTGIDVFYTVGDKKYVAHLPAGLVNCPKTMTAEHCLALT